jgi:hypothetical protein
MDCHLAAVCSTSDSEVLLPWFISLYHVGPSLLDWPAHYCLRPNMLESGISIRAWTNYVVGDAIAAFYSLGH